MKVSRPGRTAGLALCGALALSACGTDSNSPPSSAPAGGGGASGGASSGAGGGAACATGSLTASGSTAQKNAMADFTKAYQTKCSGATVNYQATGSGAGIIAFSSKQVDFAGSDSALKPEEQPKADARCGSGKAINLPMVTGPVALAYNLSGVDSLVLDAPTTANIFAGKISMWNDPAIAKLNSGAKLPGTKIQPFHRSDESGTTDNFQKYLTAAAPQAWTFGKGKKFGAPGGQSAAKSDGVTQAVKSNDGAITYVEKSFADNASLSVAKIATGASAPVELTADTAGKAVEAAKVVGTGKDLALKLDYATKADGAYPLILVTYEIVCEQGNDPAKLPLLKGFLGYTSSTAGQSTLKDLGYAPLPESIRSKVETTAAALG